MLDDYAGKWSRALRFQHDAGEGSLRVGVEEVRASPRERERRDIRSVVANDAIEVRAERVRIRVREGGAVTCRRGPIARKQCPDGVAGQQARTRHMEQFTGMTIPSQD